MMLEFTCQQLCSHQGESQDRKLLHKMTQNDSRNDKHPGSRIYIWASSEVWSCCLNMIYSNQKQNIWINVDNTSDRLSTCFPIDHYIIVIPIYKQLKYVLISKNSNKVQAALSKCIYLHSEEWKLHFNKLWLWKWCMSFFKQHSLQLYIKRRTCSNCHFCIMWI